MRHKLPCILIASALVTCIDRRANAAAAEVRAALAERYPAANVIREGELQFEQETAVERVDLPALAKGLPDVRFSTTSFRTGYYEFPQVSAAVAASKRGTIAVCLSPTYGEPDRTFMEILTNTRVSQASDEPAVARELARLFAIITYKGEIKKSCFAQGRFSAELWHGDLLWRRVLIEVAKGRVSSVALMNPKKTATAPAGGSMLNARQTLSSFRKEQRHVPCRSSFQRYQYPGAGHGIDRKDRGFTDGVNGRTSDAS